MNEIKRHITKTVDSIPLEERIRLLGQKGLVIWMTGLSGSGKSTISIEVERMLLNSGKWVFRLDGDNLRHGLNSDLSFTKEDRHENIRRIAEVSALFADAGLIVLVSTISPYERLRTLSRKIVGHDRFIEVYVSADLETCQTRDPKGLYAKAIENEIPHFTGITDVYEVPKNPDLILDTVKATIAECANTLISYVAK